MVYKRNKLMNLIGIHDFKNIRRSRGEPASSFIEKVHTKIKKENMID